MADTVCIICGDDWDIHHIRHDTPFYAYTLFRAGKGCETCRGQQPETRPDVEEVCRQLVHGGTGECVAERLGMIELEDDQKDYHDEWKKAEEDFVLLKCEGCDTVVSFEQEQIYPIHDEKTDEMIQGITIWHDDRYGGTLGLRERVAIKDLRNGTIANGRNVDLTHFDSDWCFQEVHGKTVCEKCWDDCDGQTAQQFEHRENPATGLMENMPIEDSVKSCDERVFIGEAHSQFVGDTYDPGSSFYIQDLDKTFCSDCNERLPYCNHCGANWDFGDTDIQFVEEDENRCTNCSSWVKCDGCNEWVEETDEDDQCSTCAEPDCPPNHPDE